MSWTTLTVETLSGSYGLYCSYKSYTDWMVQYTLQHGLTAWAWNWKTKVKYTWPLLSCPWLFLSKLCNRFHVANGQLFFYQMNSSINPTINLVIFTVSFQKTLFTLTVTSPACLYWMYLFNLCISLQVYSALFWKCVN